MRIESRVRMLQEAVDNDDWVKARELVDIALREAGGIIGDALILAEHASPNVRVCVACGDREPEWVHDCVGRLRVSVAAGDESRSRSAAMLLRDTLGSLLLEVASAASQIPPKEAKP
jgi:hypothetical protein